MSNVPEITARWQLQVNDDRTLVNLARSVDDPLRNGTWSDRGNDGFTISWPDGRSTDYQTLGNGFIDDGGSRCHEDFYPMRPSDTVMLATHSEVPAFECSNGSTAPWYWVLNKDYTLQDLDGESAGTWSQLGTGISVTNQNNDLTQWEILGSDLTTSWGSCQHIAGPELTTQFFNLDYDGTRIFDIPWDGESLIGKTVQCDYYHFIDGEWRPGDGQTLSGLPSLWDFYSDATGQFNTFRQSTDGVFNWTVNDAGEYVIDILDQEFPYIHMLSQSGRRMVRRGDIWQLLPDHNGSLSGNDWQGGGFGCQVINR